MEEVLATSVLAWNCQEDTGTGSDQAFVHFRVI